jgi:hypothetical protein
MVKFAATCALSEKSVGKKIFFIQFKSVLVSKPKDCVDLMNSGLVLCEHPQSLDVSKV